MNINEYSIYAYLCETSIRHETEKSWGKFESSHRRIHSKIRLLFEVRGRNTRFYFLHGKINKL